MVQSTDTNNIGRDQYKKSFEIDVKGWYPKGQSVQQILSKIYKSSW